MASEEHLSEAAKAMQELLGAATEINFYTDSQADPGTAAIFTELFKDSQRRFGSSAQEAGRIYQDYLSTGKPFGLFLRAFESEAYRYHVPGGEFPSEERELFRLRGPQSIERHLHSSVHRLVPFIALVSPVDLLASGLIPRFSGGSDGDWESAVERVARDAAIIVFHCYALGPGVSVELDLLRRSQLEDSTVIVLKSAGSPTESDAMQILSRIADVTNYEVPGKNHTALAGFSRVAYESEIDWSRPEKSPFLGDLLQAALRWESSELAGQPDLAGLPPANRMVALSDRARALRREGLFEDAAAAAAEALAIAKRLRSPEDIAAAHIGAGIVALEMGRLDAALKAFYDSGRMYESLGNKDGEATAAAWAGRALKKAGDADNAVRMFLVALQCSQELKAYEDMADTLRQMAPLLGQISPELRRHPGVRRAAELIELDPDQS
jgi:tetratricopeptide (TPR) repeat protein